MPKPTEAGSEPLDPRNETFPALPAITAGRNLARYFQEIQKVPFLSREEEYMLAKRWREHGDAKAAHQLVASHLRLVAKIAMGYRGYGLPLPELISEGNVGMMQAVKRFDPERGFRFASYAIWWIRATIQEYILHSWSLVKMGTTAAQKKLFFNLRSLKRQLGILGNGDLSPEAAKTIADKLNVPETAVIEMNQRLAAAPQSLNTPIGEDGDAEWQDWIQDESESQESLLGEQEEIRLRRDLFRMAMTRLTERERHIITERRLTDAPRTLEDLAREYGITRERVRQIEESAVLKLQKGVKVAAHQRRLGL